MSSALNLSLLARGIGEVKRGNQEKVDVVLEASDYFNFTETSSTNFDHKFHLPPIQPRYAFPDTPRSNSSTASQDPQRLPLPKTFITRKGALLLFSEEFAQKNKEREHGSFPTRNTGVGKSLDDLKLHTVHDLTKSILSYGTQNKDAVNLRFVKEGGIAKRVRPGFSARRYLSRLTRSFDDTFLDNLLTKGYVSEKSLFQSSDLLPNLRRRINDDLSYMPPPYRIMRHMLLAPGLLSGFSFFRQATASTELSTLHEEDEEAIKAEAERHLVKGSIQVVDIRDGVAHPVSYSDLPKEDKQNVLADLLVKSAINHALEKQKEILDSKDNSHHSVGIHGMNSGEEYEHDMHQEKHHIGRPVGDFMTDAVQSYLDSQLSTQLPEDPLSSRSLKGSKVQGHSAKSFEDVAVDSFGNPWKPINEEDELELVRHRLLPDTVGHKEYVNGVPVVQLKETRPSSAGSAASSSRPTASTPWGTASVGSVRTQHLPSHQVPLTPIRDQEDDDEQDAYMNNLPVLPPIRHGKNNMEMEYSSEVPVVNIEPPTPQHSMLANAGKRSVSREPRIDNLMESEEEFSEEGSRWDGNLSESELLSERQRNQLEARKNERQRQRNRLKASKGSVRGSQQSVLSTASVDSSSSRGAQLIGGSQMESSTESVAGEYNQTSGPQMGKFKGKSLRTGGRAQKARAAEKKSKGSVIMFGGEAVSVGGSVTQEPPEPLGRQTFQALPGDHTASDNDSEQEPEWAGKSQNLLKKNPDLSHKNRLAKRRGKHEQRQKDNATAADDEASVTADTDPHPSPAASVRDPREDRECDTQECDIMPSECDPSQAITGWGYKAPPSPSRVSPDQSPDLSPDRSPPTPPPGPDPPGPDTTTPPPVPPNSSVPQDDHTPPTETPVELDTSIDLHSANCSEDRMAADLYSSRTHSLSSACSHSTGSDRDPDLPYSKSPRTRHHGRAHCLPKSEDGGRSSRSSHEHYSDYNSQQDPVPHNSNQYQTNTPRKKQRRRDAHVRAGDRHSRVSAPGGDKAHRGDSQPEDSTTAQDHLDKGGHRYDGDGEAKGSYSPDSSQCMADEGHNVQCQNQRSTLSKYKPVATKHVKSYRRRIKMDYDSTGEVDPCTDEDDVVRDNSSTPSGDEYEKAEHLSNGDQPGVPSNEDQPGVPSNEDQSGVPSNEDQPGVPSNEDQPGVPSNEDQPGFPSNEDQPGVPSNEDQPGVPSNEDQPGVSSNEDQPGVPSNEDQPGVSSNEDQPGVPSNEDQPGVPSNEDQSGVPSNEDQSGVPSNEDQSGVPSNEDQSGVPSNEPGAYDDIDKCGTPNDDTTFSAGAEIQLASPSSQTDLTSNRTEHEDEGDEKTVLGAETDENVGGARGRKKLSEVTLDDITEQDLVHNLSEHAHKIAASILDRPDAGLDLAQDAQVAVSLWMEREHQDELYTSIEGTLGEIQREEQVQKITEFKESLKRTINETISQAGGDLALIPEDADISDEVVRALASKQNIGPGDLEVVTDESGKKVVRIKSSVRKSLLAAQASTAENMGSSKSGAGSHRPGHRGSGGMSEAASTGALSTDQEQGQGSQKEGTLTGAREQSKMGDRKKEETKEEFVVGKVKDPKEMERLYGRIESPTPKVKEKKPRVPPAKGKKSPGKKKQKSSKSKGSDKVSRSESEKGDGSSEKDETESRKSKTKSGTEGKSSSRGSASRTDSQESDKQEDSDMDFDIVRDEFSEDEDVTEDHTGRSYRSFKSTQPSSDVDSDGTLDTVSSKEARAAKRAAQASKRREEVERKRREREDGQKREKMEFEERERMQRHLEEERRRKEEERRMKREQEDEERRKREQEELDRDRRAALQAEREKKQKEEYQRRLETMKRQKEEDDRKRKEREEQQRLKAEEQQRQEEEMLAKMAEEERFEYLRKKAEDEERKRVEEEEKKRREAEEVARLEAEARRMAEEVALRQAELERRLQFNRSLNLESGGLEHTQNVTQAFTWSYFELLQWLGLEIPDFEQMKASRL